MIALSLEIPNNNNAKLGRLLASTATAIAAKIATANKRPNAAAFFQKQIEVERARRTLGAVDPFTVQTLVEQRDALRVGALLERVRHCHNCKGTGCDQCMPHTDWPTPENQQLRNRLRVAFVLNRDQKQLRCEAPQRKGATFCHRCGKNAKSHLTKINRKGNVVGRNLLCAVTTGLAD